MEYIGVAIFTALFISIILWLAPVICNLLGMWANLIFSFIFVMHQERNAYQPTYSMHGGLECGD